MESLLPRSMDSLCIKEFIDQLEIIVVNDGSKDNTLGIANKFKEIYPNSVIVIDKSNGNYGSCVNAGLSIASGKYFRILDADDFVDHDGFINFLQEISAIDSDLVISNYIRENSFKNKIQKIDLSDKNLQLKHCYSIEEIDIFKLGLAENFVMHTMTYKTQVLREASLHLSEGISYTDTEYCYYPISKVKSIIFLDTLVYRYQLGRDGQTMSKESFMKNREHLFKILKRIFEYEVLNNIPNDNAQKIRASVLLMASKFYYYIILCHVGYNKSDDEQLQYIENQMKKVNYLYDDLNNYKVMKFLTIIEKYRRKNKYSDGFPFKQLYWISNNIKLK